MEPANLIKKDETEEVTMKKVLLTAGCLLIATNVAAVDSTPNTATMRKKAPTKIEDLPLVNNSNKVEKNKIVRKVPVKSVYQVKSLGSTLETSADPKGHLTP